MKNIALYILTFGMTAFFASCHKDDSCNAGTGGNNSIKATLLHHTKVISPKVGYPDTLFIKYDTKDFPGENASDFDAYFVNSDTAISTIEITGLKCGDYYLFGTGWDADISQRVKGGIPVTIAEDAGVLTKNVPVTED